MENVKKLFSLWSFSSTTDKDQNWGLLLHCRTIPLQVWLFFFFLRLKKYEGKKLLMTWKRRMWEPRAALGPEEEFSQWDINPVYSHLLLGAGQLYVYYSKMQIIFLRNVGCCKTDDRWMAAKSFILRNYSAWVWHSASSRVLNTMGVWGSLRGNPVNLIRAALDPKREFTPHYHRYGLTLWSISTFWGKGVVFLATHTQGVVPGPMSKSGLCIAYHIKMKNWENEMEMRLTAWRPRRGKEKNRKKL